jgi:hypothetical protein
MKKENINIITSYAKREYYIIIGIRLGLDGRYWRKRGGGDTRVKVIQ